MNILDKTQNTSYYSLSIPVLLSDCVEACVYLSGGNNLPVDIGLPFDPIGYTNWIGVCNNIRYDVTTSNCTLLSNISCTDRSIARAVGTFEINLSHVLVQTIFIVCKQLRP